MLKYCHEAHQFDLEVSDLSGFIVSNHRLIIFYPVVNRTEVSVSPDVSYSIRSVEIKFLVFYHDILA